MSVGTLTRGGHLRPTTAARARELLSDRSLLLLGALVVLAALLRFYRLGHQGFWFDEGNTALEVHFTVGQMLTLLKHYESTPPLYYGVVWVWSRIFGDTEIGLRSLSALLGVLIVPMAWAAATKLVSRRAGLIAAALVVFNPYLIWYSQEARAYSLAVLLIAASLLAFAYARENPSGRAMATWTVVAALALATEYYAVLAIAPQALWLLYRHPSRRPVWAGLGALVVWCAPLLWFAISQNSTGHAKWIAPIPLGPRLGQVIPQFLVGYGAPVLSVLQRLAEAAAVVAVVLLLTRTRGRARSGALLAGAIAIVGLIINLLLVAGGIDDLISRNVLSLWMPAAIALAGGLAAERARVIGLATTVVLCAIGVTAAVGVAFDRSLQRPDWRPLARLLGPPPASGRPARALLLQRFRTRLPLSLYMPGLEFLRDPRVQVRVSELDVIAMQAPRVSLCWWGATCNLSATSLQSSYPIPGFHAVSRRQFYPFTVLRMVANHGSAKISLPKVGAALTSTTLYGPQRDELLIQR